MSAPKSSYQPYPKRSGRRWIRVTVLLIISFFSGMIAWGFLLEGTAIVATNKDKLVLENIQKIKDENVELKRQVAVLRNTGRVDQLVAENTQANWAELKKQLSIAEKELQLYRRLTSPQNRNYELQIHSFRIFEASGSNYALILSQGVPKDKAVEGTVFIEMTGHLNGEKHQLSLEDFDADQRSELKYSFRYFQSITGGILWPEGFVLESVRVSAKPQIKGARAVIRDWSLEQLKQSSALPTHSGGENQKVLRDLSAVRQGFSLESGAIYRGISEQI